MTETLIAPPAIVIADDEPKISADIQAKVANAIQEMNWIIKERADVIHGAWVACVAQEHLLMLGPGGSGKSFLVRGMVNHIADAKLSIFRDDDHD